MKMKIFIFGVLLTSVVVYADCPEGDLACEDKDSYSIMEVEERPSGAHNWMKMQHNYADFVDDSCNKCGDITYQRTEDRVIIYID